MLELTGFGNVLRGIGLLYWVPAIGAVFLAIRYGKGTRGKIIWVAVAIAACGYLPGKALLEQRQRDAYAKEAWAYFKKLCDEKSGEKIYKTFMGVKSEQINGTNEINGVIHKFYGRPHIPPYPTTSYPP